MWTSPIVLLGPFFVQWQRDPYESYGFCPSNHCWLVSMWSIFCKLKGTQLHLVTPMFFYPRTSQLIWQIRLLYAKYSRPSSKYSLKSTLLNPVFFPLGIWKTWRISFYSSQNSKNVFFRCPNWNKQKHPVHSSLCVTFINLLGWYLESIWVR